MKKLFSLIVFTILFSSNVLADEIPMEEINLQLEPTVQSATVETDNINSTVAQEKTLQEKIQDIYSLEIEQIAKPSFLLKDILTKRFDENSKWESLHFWTGYNGSWGININDEGSFQNKYDFNAINVALDGKTKNNNFDFRTQLGFSPLSHRNFVQNLFADMYIGTNKIPHHRVQVGHYRPSVGVEGAYGAYTLPFVTRSQISRNFSSIRKLGANIKGDYSLIDYDLGIFSSDTYLQEFFPGAEFIGWVNLKPLGLTNGKYGKLKMGSGIQAGNRNNTYCVTGAYIGYEYKKFMANFEWANANGYNGPQNFSSRNHATGFYTTVGYRITPKLQILARYDQFNPNKNLGNSLKREYSLGLNYFIKGQALKLILNYVFCQNDTAKDSHRIILGTQILL